MFSSLVQQHKNIVYNYSNKFYFNTTLEILGGSKLYVEKKKKKTEEDSLRR